MIGQWVKSIVLFTSNMTLAIFVVIVLFTSSMTLAVCVVVATSVCLLPRSFLAQIRDIIKGTDASQWPMAELQQHQTIERKALYCFCWTDLNTLWWWWWWWWLLNGAILHSRVDSLRFTRFCVYSAKIFSQFNCCITVVLLLEKGAYSENSQVLYCQVKLALLRFVCFFFHLLFYLLCVWNLLGYF